MAGKRSIALFEEALGMIPGGVNSPVRIVEAIRIPSPFVDGGKGSHLWDMDGNEDIDEGP
jgi:glutamate-1-semialdehyde 2,1-aminomutase